MLELSQEKIKEASIEYLFKNFLENTVLASEIKDAFITGAEYTAYFYKLQLEVVIQKMNSYKNKLGEIDGGVYR